MCIEFDLGWWLYAVKEYRSVGLSVFCEYVQFTPTTVDYSKY